MSTPYDERFDPPAPVLPVRLRLPESGDWLQLVGLVDTGADASLFPFGVADEHLPLVGLVGVRGVTGDVERAGLYRAEVQIGGALRALVVAGMGSETILGRDVLNRFVLGLDGPARRLTIEAGMETT
jgi:predicted aspartyl protease